MDSISSPSPSSSCGSLDATDVEAGFSGCAPCIPYPPSPPSSHARDWRRRRRRESYRGMMASPSVRFFVEEEYDEPRHFLDSCFLCNRSLAGNRDIFMYRGDTPFCSEECRQEQIEMDEAREKKLKLSLKNSSTKEQQSASKTNAATSPPKSQKIHVRAGTVVAG